MPDKEKVIHHIKAEIEIAKICKKDFASVDIDMLSDAYELLKESDEFLKHECGMTERKKVEFIESYIKIGNGDYEWSDNHGELIRCKDCRFYNSQPDSHGDRCDKIHWSRSGDWYCADGERD